MQQGPGPPGGLSFDDVRLNSGVLDATDGDIHQAALDAGWEVED